MDQSKTEPHGPIANDGPEVIHLIVHDTDQLATEPKAGVTLHTRDGSRIGNAIILRVTSVANRPQYHIETDFGNVTKLFIEELEEMFTLGYQLSYERWWDDRLETIQKSVENFGDR
jgi:hypothetical protein